MEIVTYVIDGAIEHKDSMGNGTIITAGEVQRMTAGTGVRTVSSIRSHDSELHLLQIWIYPEKNGLQPGYEQIHFPRDEQAESAAAWSARAMAVTARSRFTRTSTCMRACSRKTSRSRTTSAPGARSSCRSSRVTSMSTGSALRPVMAQRSRTLRQSRLLRLARRSSSYSIWAEVCGRLPHARGARMPA